MFGQGIVAEPSKPFEPGLVSTTVMILCGNNEHAPYSAYKYF